ncbi:hypothetical protein BC835DRAFT_1385556 [Cytidiella melzeri]|nr:hypothetical protein BC835DRAFT_1385556 [Cytidiella melzeri]
MHSNTALASRRRTMDLPTKPEAGLAEWTSRIKELQRQVDADEDAETKRLEEEIAASRLARIRRSTGLGTSVDLSTTDVARSLRELSTTPAPAADREQSQTEALKKLSGDNRSPSLSSRVRDNGALSKPSTSPQPISLAAFMGGRATGPRLNRHAPQQDAHDPTLFEQRSITAPHPVFGRNGVAMPGMVGKGRVANRNEEESHARPATTPSQDRKPGQAQDGVSSLRSLVQNAEERRQALASQKVVTPSPVDIPHARQRTISTPSAASLSSSSASSWKREPLRDYSSPPTSVRPTTPGTHSSSYNAQRSGRHTPTRSITPAEPSRTDSISPLPQSLTSQPSSYTPTPKSLPTSSAPGLAKAIQPATRKSYNGPEIPLTQSPSASFLRTPAAKEPTPSISRLQGRGFVQSRIKASSDLESSSSYSAGSPSASPGEKGREPTKKASVLDRWQFGGDSGSPPIIAPKPMPLRKSRTVDPSTSSPTSPATPTFTPPPTKVIKPEYTGKSLKSVASLPSIAQAAAAQVSTRTGYAKSEVATERGSPSSQKRGLGSSTTMISYIKPLKTGDNPPTNASPSRPASAAGSRSRAASPEVDEMGLRVRSRTRSVGGSEVAQERQAGASTGKPLSHPTKGRARKPRKGKAGPNQVPSKPEPEEPASREPVAISHSIDDAGVTSFDVKNLLAKQTAPLKVDVTPAVQSQAEDDVCVSGAGRRVHFPLEIPSGPPPRIETPHSPIRHTRIPSTGNRATVMDVAQALHAHEELTKRLPQDVTVRETVPEVTVPSTIAGSDIGAARPDVKSMLANWGSPNAEIGVAPVPSPVEKRKSSYEKYSAFALPPLLEEKTPVQSPASTFSRDTGRSVASAAAESKPSRDSTPVPEKSSVASAPLFVSVQQEPDSTQSTSAVEDKFIFLKHDVLPLPKVDVAALFHATSQPFTPTLGVQTVSVEVMSIQGTTASAIAKDFHIFYDSEVLAIIHRSKSDGLVSTTVWAWRGSKSHVGEREERKLKELAQRYHTPLITVREYSEPPELVHVLGGRLATRQGLRAHWSAENTAMHLVRSLHGVIYIDELELGIKNLCSGFSYCLSLLETFYVWHGYASTAEERRSALQYAQSLSSSSDSIVELVEGESDEDEMFWLILGEGDYARADHWRWKPSVSSFNPRVWRVNADGGSRSSLVPSSLGTVPDVHSSVHVVDVVWEIFVIVGSDARGHRKDIRLALSVADELSVTAAPSRPFAPPVHVLVLPSRIPIDLRLACRDLDESTLNKNATPDHMNLLPSALALEHLQKTSWNKDALKDSDMLPLGVKPVS